MPRKLTHKQCRKCEKWKTFTSFHKSTSSKDGLQPWCKVCRRLYDRAYFKSHQNKRQANRKVNRRIEQIIKLNKLKELIKAHADKDEGEPHV